MLKFSQEGENCRENQEFGEEVEQISFSFLEYLPLLREVLAQDVGHSKRRSCRCQQEEIVLAYPGLIAVSVYRIANFLHKQKVL